ncbi:hypothetical protein A3K63_02680 [Candidatus Micrarchaeota archaeon RBG_16_49_10]|nr:MAG: hypothetical protein A3K63_02680 [Candidatus Micrarchaeota archaeon RBG_16_49_10]
MMRARLSAIFFLLFFLSITPGIMAFEMRGGEEVKVPSSMTIDDDFYAAGGNVQVDGVIKGDLVAAGGNVKFTGEVTEDLIVAGGNIELGGLVKDDLRVAGGSISFKGDSGDDLILAGGEGNVSPASVIGGDLIIAGGDVLSEGKVDGDVIVNAGDVRLGGKVAGNVSINAGKVEILPGTVIGGDLNVTSNDVKIAEDAVIGGEFTQSKGDARKSPAKSRVGSAVTKYFTSLVIGVVMILLFQDSVRATYGRIVESPGKSALMGLLFVFAVPIACLVLVFTIVGIPLAIIGVVVYVVVLYLSRIFVALAIGEKILGKSKKTFGLMTTLALGLLVWVVLTVLPVVGFFVILATVILGSGAVFMRGKAKKQRKGRD